MSDKNSAKSSSKIIENKQDEEKSAIFNDRVCPQVPYPATNRLKCEDVFEETTGMPKIDLLKKHFIKEGRLDESAALRIIKMASAKLKSERNLIEIAQPVVIVGDLHGQYYDLLKIFDIGGSLSKISYLFLGDYVDRGHFSVEIVLYLWSLKIIYPEKLTLLRGNHECRHLADHFTFKRECLIKYSQKVYDACIKSFCNLPLCALVNKQLFCVHGGISPQLLSLNDVNKLNRDREPPSHGLMCDLLWADPAQDYNDEVAIPTNVAFTANSTRGCSFYYNYNAVSNFLQNNDLLCVIRAHEAQDNGFRMYKNMEKTEFPSVITIFSAPNYLDVYNNKGAIIVYEKDMMNTKQFSCTTHPYWLPNFMDVFTWSLPFVAEKVTELFLFIFKLNTDDVLDKREVMKAKLTAISRIARMYTKIRERNESLIELKGIAPSDLTFLNSVANISLKDDDNDDDEKSKSDSMISNKNESSELGLLGGEFKFRRKLSLEEIKELDKQNECLPKDFNSSKK
jgi:serine/threonine-protein phosphatase 2B catalytic subunit